MPRTPEERLQQAEERLTVLLAQSGDREAFSKLVELYDRRLYYYLARLLGNSDDALDVLQGVWLRVHRYLDRLDSPAAFRVWIYRIAHRAAMTELRRRSRGFRLSQSVEQPPPEAAQAEDDLERFENAELVHRGLQQLSLEHRQVLTLRFVEEMSIEEIAAVIHIRPGTVQSRLYYARQALREVIQEFVHD